MFPPHKIFGRSLARMVGSLLVVFVQGFMFFFFLGGMVQGFLFSTIHVSPRFIFLGT